MSSPRSNSIQFDTHAKQARATDINSIKKAIASYLEPVTFPSERTVSPPTSAAQRTNKVFFGYEADWTTWQLIRPDAIDEFDEDPAA